jgi:uncharacterized protein (TIGR03083 family)
MSELADRVISALRAEHETLVRLVAGLDEERLAAPSGAEEWTVAQVLSHLGSGAEIGRAPIARAAGQQVEAEENRAIWDRWDGSSPVDQAAGFVEHNARWLETVEALTPEQRSSLVVDLGFLPEPVPLVTALGMRLNEVANHSWDARVAFDSDAEILADSAAALVELIGGPVGFMLGWLAKPAELGSRLDGPVAVPAAGVGLLLGESVGLVEEPVSPAATFQGSPAALVRLVNGRLRAPYAAGVSVEGEIGLDDLRRVFPGF